MTANQVPTQTPIPKTNAGTYLFTSDTHFTSRVYTTTLAPSQISSHTPTAISKPAKQGFDFQMRLRMLHVYVLEKGMEVADSVNSEIKMANRLDVKWSLTSILKHTDLWHFGNAP